MGFDYCGIYIKDVSKFTEDVILLIRIVISWIDDTKINDWPNIFQNAIFYVIMLGMLIPQRGTSNVQLQHFKYEYLCLFRINPIL